MTVLPPEIDTLVARLVAAFDAEEVILFGSRAYGTPGPDSDADLLLVLRATAEPAPQRMARAARVAGEARVAADVLPYTPEEIRAYLAHGNTVVRDALARGTVLYPVAAVSRYAVFLKEWSPAATAAEWLQRAREDLNTAELLVDAGGGRYRQWWVAANHAQQAAEKALKALIYHLGGEPVRTHRLSELALAAAELNRAVGRRILLRHGPKIGELTPYAVAARYPEGPAVTELQAREALEISSALLADVTVAVEGGAGPSSPRPAVS